MTYERFKINYHFDIEKEEKVILRNILYSSQKKDSECNVTIFNRTTAYKLSKCELDVTTTNGTEFYYIFASVKYPKASDVAILKLNDDVKQILSHTQQGYAVLPLIMMTNNRHINLYKEILSKIYRSVSKDDSVIVQMSLEDVRATLDPKHQKSYDHTGHLKSKLLKPAINEISMAANWEITVDDCKSGAEITGFSFGIKERAEILKLPIIELDFSVRAFNCLTKAGVATLGDLCDKTCDEIMHIRNLSKKTFDEVMDKMAEYGLSPKAFEEMTESGALPSTEDSLKEL